MQDATRSAIDNRIRRKAYRDRDWRSRFLRGFADALGIDSSRW